MADYIYDDRGEAQGFRMGSFLYRMDGKAVGRVSAERVYRLDGEYVGELFKNMVVEKPVQARRRLPSIAIPPDAEPPPGNAPRLRNGHGFPDVFDRLDPAEAQAGAADRNEG